MESGPTVVAAAALLLAGLPAGALAGDPFEQAPAIDGLQVHPSIHIFGDEDLDPTLNPLNGVRFGNGTAEDPYVIRDWYILKSTGYGIQLVNTSAHVLIENVVVDRSTVPGAGIGLEGVENVTIQDLAVPTDRTGIHAEDVAHLRVRDASLGGFDNHPDRALANPSLWFGLILKRGEDVHVTNVSIDDADRPIFVGESGDVRFEELHVTRAYSSNLITGTDGITVAHSLMENQTIWYHGNHTNITLLENVFRANRSGSGLLGGGSSTFDAHVEEVYLCGNVFEGMVFGSDIGSADHVVARHNRFLHNQAGPDIRALERIEFHGNEIRNATTLKAVLLAPEIDAHKNSIVSDEAFIMNTPDGDARDNWWGSVDGPSEDGPGSGTQLRIAGNTTFEPWLTEEPTISTDCIPGEPRTQWPPRRTVPLEAVLP